jgi:hypothetical protein
MVGWKKKTMLFSPAIRRFLHSTIRSNHCFAIIGAIVHRDSETLASFTQRTQKFLSERKDSVFPVDREKYLTFMEYMRRNAPESELLDDDYLCTNEYVFKLYHLPKKRNNFLLFFLLGYYVSRTPEGRLDPLSQSVYLYYSIIAYRCRPSDEMRRIYSELPTRRFVSFGRYLRDRSAPFVAHLAQAKRVAMVLAGGVLGALAGFAQHADLTAMRISADASGAGLSLVDPSSLLYTFILGEYNSDFVKEGISSFSLEKILTLAVILFAVQAVRGSFKDVFVDSAISKAVTLVFDAIKSAVKTVFALYSYIVWQTTTHYIFAVSNAYVRRGIVPSVVGIAFFAIGYFGIHAAIVGCYALAADALLGWYLSPLALAGLTFIVASFAIGINFYADKKNFEEFLLEINTLYEHLGKNSLSTPEVSADPR